MHLFVTVHLAIVGDPVVGVTPRCVFLAGRILGNSDWRKNLRCGIEKSLFIFCVTVCLPLIVAVIEVGIVGLITLFLLMIFIRNKLNHFAGDFFYMDAKTIP